MATGKKTSKKAGKASKARPKAKAKSKSKAGSKAKATARSKPAAPKKPPPVEEPQDDEFWEDSQPAELEPEESMDDRERALDEFFASAEELEAAGSMSLDLYREQLDTRLRAEGVQEYLSFVLADETYAVNIFHIKEIIKQPPITEVPRTELVVLGVLSLRGTIAPVVDLRRRLGLDAAPHTRKTRVLIVQMNEELVGLLVDEVRHVIRLKDEDIEPPPGVFDRAEAEHIVGVGRHEGEMYTLLDLDSIIQIDRFLKV